MESINKTTEAPSVQITATEIRVTSPEQLIPVLVRKLRIPVSGTTKQMLNYLNTDEALFLADNNQFQIMFMMTVVIIMTLLKEDQTPAVAAAISEKMKVRDALFEKLCSMSP